MWASAFALLLILPVAVQAVNMAGPAPDSLVASSAKGDIYVVYDRSFSATDQMIVEKLGLQGGRLWWRTYAYGQRRLSPTAAATDSEGNLWIVGNLAPPPAGPERSFVMKYTPAGDLVFYKSVDDWKETTIYHVATDEAGNGYLSGCVSNRSGVDAALYKWSPKGDVIYSKVHDSGMNDYVRSMTVDFEGNFVRLNVEKTLPGQDQLFKQDTLRFNRSGQQSY